MKIIVTIIIALVVLALVVFAFMNWGGEANAYETYSNDRYGYVIDYPTTFTAQGVAQNGDGQVFSGENATLEVFGAQNTSGDSLRTIAEQYTGTSVTSVTTEIDTTNEVRLRTETAGNVTVVQVIQLANGAVGVAVLEYQTDAVSNTTIATIFESFTVIDDTNRDVDNDNSATAPGDGSVSDGSGSIPSGYRLYTNDNLQFSILVPESASVEPANENYVKIMYLGSGNEDGTEISNGFHVTVFREDLPNSYDSARTYAQAVYDDTESGSENTIVDGLESRQVNGMTAYRYSYTGALGSENTEYIFLAENGAVGYQISYSVSDPNNNNYEDAVFTMLESFRFDAAVASDPPRYDEVQLALLDRQGETNGQERGCDRVVMVDESIEATTAPLTAALERLFAIDEETYQGWHHFIASTNDTLSFDRARVENSTAHIYLAGELTGLAGVCDNPRARIQIEETALQFQTVDDVQLYLNGSATDLQPSGA